MKTQVYPPVKSGSVFGVVAIALIAVGIFIYLKHQNDDKETETNFATV